MATRRTRFRTKLCRNFALGHCPQGDKCNYIHASPQVIQKNSIGPILQPSISQRSQDDQLSVTTFSPSMWPSLSPATNTSSEQFTYHDTSASSNTGVSSSRIKYRSLSWRTTLCRHFLKNRGWCPLGDECNYIHDLTLADFAKDDVRFSIRRSSSAIGGKHGERDRGKAGSKHSHCWAYVQGLCHVQDCPYLHPVAIQMFAAHTPCLAWPNCRRGPLCPYKHPEPYISNSANASPTQSPANSMPNPPTQYDAVPRGAMQYNGVFYVGVPQHAPPSIPPPLLQMGPPPVQQPFMFTNPWEVWQLPYTPMASVPGYTPIAVNAPAWPAITLANANLNSRLPAFPQLAGHAMDGDPASHQPGNYTYHPVEESPEAAYTVSAAPEGDFPYLAPKNQRAGHARRVSVTIKNREDLDALGLDSSSHQRLPWQTHSDRLGRRSWAPQSSRTADGTPPPPMLYGV